MKQGRKVMEGVGGVVSTSLNRLMEEDIPEKATLPQVSEGDEAWRLVDVWGRTFWAEGTVHWNGAGEGECIRR